jgi:hypothetical protein
MRWKLMVMVGVVVGVAVVFGRCAGPRMGAVGKKGGGPTTGSATGESVASRAQATAPGKVELTAEQRRLVEEDNHEFLPTRVDISFILEHRAVPGRIDLAKAMAYRGASSRVRPPIGDGIAISDYEYSEESFVLVDRLLSFAGVPFFTHVYGTIMIVVPAEHYQDAASVLWDAEQAGYLTREKGWGR